MISPRYRGMLKSEDPIAGARLAYGCFCRIGDKCYIILDDAEVIPGEYDDEVISGFVEVIPETVECWTIARGYVTIVT